MCLVVTCGVTIQESRSSLIDFLETTFSVALDEFYQQSDDDALRVRYRGERAHVGMWFVGREQPQSDGVDYLYRKRFDDAGEDSRYLCRDGDWAENGVLLGESSVNRSIIRYVGRYSESFETRSLQEEYEHVVESLEDAVQRERSMYSLQDVVNAIHRYDFDMLKNVIAPDGESARELWKLLYSRTEDGEIVENPVEICMQSDLTVFVRAERQYHEDQRSKQYPIGLVIGYDDTPERFFTHRIPRDEALDDAAFNWTKRAVRKRMGFEVDYNDLTNNRINRDQITRLQGNLRVVPEPFETAKESYYDELIEESVGALVEAYEPLYRERELSNEVEWSIHRGSPYFSSSPSTEEVKIAQKAVDVTESAIREEQHQRDIGRLSGRLRAEILSDIYQQHVIDWVLNTADTRCLEDFANKDLEVTPKPRIFTALSNRDPPLGDVFDIDSQRLAHLVRQEVENRFTGGRQTNMQFENHVVFANPALPHPTDSRTPPINQTRLDKMVVPTEAQIIVGHDEHDTRVYTFPRGVYEFRYLIGLDPRDVTTHNLSTLNPLT